MSIHEKILRQHKAKQIAESKENNNNTKSTESEIKKTNPIYAPIESNKIENNNTMVNQPTITKNKPTYVFDIPFNSPEENFKLTTNIFPKSDKMNSEIVFPLAAAIQPYANYTDVFFNFLFF